jgi:uncharacterized tellurite resistance protein B-like protein
MGFFDRFRKNRTSSTPVKPAEARRAASLFDVPAPTPPATTPAVPQQSQTQPAPARSTTSQPVAGQDAAPAAPTSPSPTQIPQPANTSAPTSAAPATKPAPSVAPTPPAQPAQGPAQVHQVSRNAQWYGPGSDAQVAGLTLPGGMLYLGRQLATPKNINEPSLINPTLKVDTRHPDLSGTEMGYWPSYDRISPRNRGGYLTWLAGGRRSRGAAIGYVFLFFYGLERRALVDIAANPELRWELPHLRAEVVRLLDLYGEDYSFQNYATRFLDVLDMQMAEDGASSKPPVVNEKNRWYPPMSLRVDLGALAADGKPIPEEWALAWAWFHPEVPMRTPAWRCPEEFAALFALRYRESHGDGIKVRPGKTRIKLDYYAASAGLGDVNMKMDVPDVFDQAAPVRRLGAVIELVTDELSAYSRYLGRNPESRDSLAAAALLPDDLASEPTGAVADLRDWALAQADAGSAITGADLLSRWPTKSAERMAKPEMVTLAQLLQRFGFGIEPDVRLGGPAITPATPVVVFRTGPTPPSTATSAYAAATTLLHLATAVSAADGNVSAEEQQQLVDHLEASLDLSAGERTRLAAHMVWLAANGVKLTGLTKRVAVLDHAQRSIIGDLLVAVAAADGVISTEEVTTLTKIYKLIDLDPAEVHSRLHAHLTGAAAKRPTPASGPVTVREAGKPDTGYPIAPPAHSSVAGSSSGKHRADAPSTPGFSLDLASIEAKFAETAAVSALLADIFKDDEGPTAPKNAPAHTDQPSRHTEPSIAAGGETPEGVADGGTDNLAGLDAAHSAFLRALAQRPSWMRGEVEELAESWNLMPDGALDRINEAVLDLTDEPFLDEDDDLYTVNDYAREELLP